MIRNVQKLSAPPRDSVGCRSPARPDRLVCDPPAPPPPAEGWHGSVSPVGGVTRPGRSLTGAPRRVNSKLSAIQTSPPPSSQRRSRLRSSRIGSSAGRTASRLSTAAHERRRTSAPTRPSGRSGGPARAVRSPRGRPPPTPTAMRGPHRADRRRGRQPVPGSQPGRAGPGQHERQQRGQEAGVRDDLELGVDQGQDRQRTGGSPGGRADYPVAGQQQAAPASASSTAPATSGSPSSPAAARGCR